MTNLLQLIKTLYELAKDVAVDRSAFTFILGVVLAYLKQHAFLSAIELFSLIALITSLFLYRYLRKLTPLSRVCTSLFGSLRTIPNNAISAVVESIDGADNDNTRHESILNALAYYVADQKLPLLGKPVPSNDFEIIPSDELRKLTFIQRGDQLRFSGNRRLAYDEVSVTVYHSFIARYKILKLARESSHPTWRPLSEVYLTLAPEQLSADLQNKQAAYDRLMAPVLQNFGGIGAITREYMVQNAVTFEAIRAVESEMIAARKRLEKYLEERFAQGDLIAKGLKRDSFRNTTSRVIIPADMWNALKLDLVHFRAESRFIQCVDLQISQAQRS